VAERARHLRARDTVLESSYAPAAETAPLGLAPNRRVGGRDMELEKARARRSISNTQSVLVVKAEIYGLTRCEHDWFPIHRKLQSTLQA
jgi:hypothetical protein